MDLFSLTQRLIKLLGDEEKEWINPFQQVDEDMFMYNNKVQESIKLRCVL